MQIKCPECGFTREVNISQIPAKSSFATCPKCAVRFRFRADPAGEEAPASDEALKAAAPDEAAEGDIWASMDKMRREWDEIDREDEDRPTNTPHNAPTDSARPAESRPGAKEPHPERGEGDPGRGDATDPGEPDYENEADRREEAARAYRQEDGPGGPGGPVPFLSTVGSVPWEYRGGFLNPLVFLRTIILMVTRAPQFFSGVNPYSSIIPSWVFLIVVRGVQTGVAIKSTRLLSSLPDGTQQVLAMHEVFNLPMLIFMSMCMITLLHFLSSFIVNYSIQTLARSRASFRLTFKVLAYANMPILLSVIPGSGNLLGLLGSLILFFVGIRYAYAFSWRKATISVLPYLIIAALFLLMLLQAAMGGAG